MKRSLVSSGLVEVAAGEAFVAADEQFAGDADGGQLPQRSTTYRRRCSSGRPIGGGGSPGDLLAFVGGAADGGFGGAVAVDEAPAGEVPAVDQVAAKASPPTSTLRRSG